VKKEDLRETLRIDVQIRRRMNKTAAVRQVILLELLLDQVRKTKGGGKGEAEVDKVVELEQ
jgi:hypothetical protein